MRYAFLLLAALCICNLTWADESAKLATPEGAPTTAEGTPPAKNTTEEKAKKEHKDSGTTKPGTGADKDADNKPGIDNTLEHPLTQTFWLIFIASTLATFVASIMADEQEQRLRNGTFGAVAGSSVGALAALITSERLLVVSGFCGSAAGALLGWLVSLLLSFLAAKTVTGKIMLAYQINGLKGVQALISLEENEPLKLALAEWGRRFTRRIDRQQDELVLVAKSGTTDEFITILLRGWLYATVDTLGLLFQIAKKPEYRNRITIIVFGTDDKNQPRGRHWISDSGELAPHDNREDFDENSIGYKVVTGQELSPFFLTNKEASEGGKPGQNRGDKVYRPFWTFRINDATVLSIDWPGDLTKEDRFLNITRDLFNLDVCPKIQALLAHWSNPSQFYKVVNLNGPLPPKPVVAPLQAAKSVAPVAPETKPAPPANGGKKES